MDSERTPTALAAARDLLERFMERGDRHMFNLTDGRAFDGWVGLDDGEFSTRLTLEDMEEPEGLLRRVVAMASEGTSG